MNSQDLVNLLKTLEQQFLFVTNQLAKQNQDICDLQVKCASLESILLHIVVKSISENDKEMYSTIQKIASDTLTLLPEENKGDDFAEKLKNILGIREQVMPKPILRIVKPQKSDVSLPD